ncbi:hypothetical protein VNO78_32783 [Psophocarpus tetragonolobus]|uniref:Uncharacterized protein n=1 Tax=Psophocarpus tetragonolobus TaxID=3891 RepID=A0AAN9NX77_PSOTE
MLSLVVATPPSPSRHAVAASLPPSSLLLSQGEKTRTSHVKHHTEPNCSTTPHHIASQLPHHRHTPAAPLWPSSLLLSQGEKRPLATLNTTLPPSYRTTTTPHHRPVAISPPHCYCTTFVNRHRLCLTLTRIKICTSHTAQFSYHRHPATLITTPLSSPIVLLSLLELNDTSSHRLNCGVLSSVYKTLKHRFHLARLHSVTLISLQPITLYSVWLQGYCLLLLQVF